MDNLVELYTTSAGRIGRQQWWIGVIVLAIVNIIVQVLVATIFGLWTNPPAVAWVGLIMFLIVGYPLYNLYLKRRHDRDNNGLDAIIYLAVLVISLLLQALGMAVDPSTMQPTMIYGAFSIILLIYSIYMLVVMGFLRGTPGPNQYGPDPLGTPAAA